MFSRIFSPAQLQDYKKTCFRLRSASNEGLKVQLNFLESDSKIWLGKLIRLENEFYLKRKKKRKQLFSININRIKNAQLENGLLNIEYS